MDYIEDVNGKHLVHISLSLTIEADITHRDEDTSFYDREEQQYLIKNYVKWREKHQVNIAITIACAVEKDENGEFTIGEAIIINEDRFKTIDLDEDTLLDWDELDTQHRKEPDLVFCSECGKVIGHAADYFDYDDNPICGDCMVGNSNGEICPACGRKVPTDLMVNDFCQDCAQDFD